MWKIHLLYSLVSSVDVQRAASFGQGARPMAMRKWRWRLSAIEPTGTDITDITHCLDNLQVLKSRKRLTRRLEKLPTPRNNTHFVLRAFSNLSFLPHIDPIVSFCAVSSIAGGCSASHVSADSWSLSNRHSWRDCHPKNVKLQASETT